MERGDQVRIAKHTGLSKAIISRALKGERISHATFVKIVNAILHLDIKADISVFNHKNCKIDRWDIYNNLPSGAKTRIAKKCGCSIFEVSRILEGRKEDVFSVIKEAELEAAINIWKTRFCKYRSLL
jgi:transcriptional regulator with XRE-family HTH domain